MTIVLIDKYEHLKYDMNINKHKMFECERGLPMPECVVIADDLTGANATGVLLKKMNYKAYTVMNAERIELSILADCDCVLYPTDSRGVEAQVAYNRVYNVCRLLKNDGVKIYSKRIDSTLRGNLGSETDAMLDCLGENYVAIAAALFSGIRKSRDRRLYVGRRNTAS